MIITLAGHVDHGKTAIVHALTGVNTDRLKEEQARGLTIDLGFAYTTIESHRIGFVDVPGHHRFIHNMIAGVASQQHALLVIAADDGIMPQTIEHTQILQLLGVRSGTIVLNKIDLVSKERVEHCHLAIDEFKREQFLKDARVFDVAATTGQGIEGLRSHLVDAAQQFDSSGSNQPFRLAIDRSFNLRGAGTVVTGTVASGNVKIGDEVHLTAIDSRVRIRNLNVQGLDSDTAHIGDRCSLNIAGSNVNQAQRGDWLISLEHEFPIRRAFIELSLLSDFPRTLKHWSSVHVYHLTDHTEARLALLEGNTADPGTTVLAELHCKENMHFKAGDRLILRDRDLSRTLGGASVLAYARDSNMRRRSEANLSFLRSLHSVVRDQEHESSFDIYAAHGLVSVDEFTRFSLCSREHVKYLLERDGIESSEHAALGSSVFDELSTSICRSISEFHKAHPTQEGPSVSQLEQQTPTNLPSLQFVLNRLVARGKLRHIAGQYAQVEHVAQGPTYDSELFKKVEPMFDTEQPVSLGDAAKQLRMPFKTIEDAMRPMVAAKVLIQIHKNRYLTPRRVGELHQIASELAANKPFTVREFRDASRLGRNTVIDVLEYFDRIRFTQRQGDTRVILNRAS